MTQSRYVSYIGLGPADARPPGDALQRQRAAITAYLRDGGGLLIDEVLDTGTGGVAGSRPALREALGLCRREGATLLIAELNRLSRDPGFLLSLRRLLDRSGQRVVAADMPEADEITLGIVTAVTAAEAEGVRTGGDAHLPRRRAFLAGLADRHRRGVPARPAGAAPVPACKPRTLEQAVQIAPLLAEIRAAGATTFEQVAYALNELGVPSARGVRWYPSQVRRVEQRIASIS